jgi:hypothetical protein
MGGHDIYCVICGISASDFYNLNEDIKNLKNIINKGEFNIPSKSKIFIYKLSNKIQKITPELLLNYKKYIEDVKELQTTFKWCSELYLITLDKVITELKSFKLDDWGHFYKNKERYVTSKSFWEDDNKALICHKSCYNLLSKKLNYKLEINDIYKKINGLSLLSNYKNNLNKYIGKQDFPWTALILNENKFINFEKIMSANKKLEINYNNINYLSDPLKNTENEKRIIDIWKPIISKLKNKKIRPSPSESATMYKIGTIKKGNDGNLYTINLNKNKVKTWKKINK